MWLKRLRIFFLPMLIMVIAIPASVCVAGVDTVWVHSHDFGARLLYPADIVIDPQGDVDRTWLELSVGKGLCR